MRKYKSAYLKPYIRKAKKQDFNGVNASDLSIAILMGMFADYPKDVYVLVQRGSNKVVSIKRSREEIKRYVATIGFQKRDHIGKKFNKWSNDVKHYCRKH